MTQFLHSFIGIRSTPQIIESGPGLVKPGESFKLTCRVSGVQLDNYFWHWIRQPPGKGLEWIAIIRNTANGGATDINSALRSQASISRDISRNEVYLQLSSPTAADTAVYFAV
uniref:Ig-like domain-containing protein n=1 Tax=Podarcis muralis TaxID=64176 RepID=A0A670K943_PODMU